MASLYSRFGFHCERLSIAEHACENLVRPQELHQSDNFEVGQACEVRDFFQSRIGYLGSVQVKIRQVCQLGDFFHPRIRYLGWLRSRCV